MYLCALEYGTKVTKFGELCELDTFIRFWVSLCSLSEDKEFNIVMSMLRMLKISKRQKKNMKTRTKRKHTNKAKKQTNFTDVEQNFIFGILTYLYK